jgi:HEAT repeat protein
MGKHGRRIARLLEFGVFLVASVAALMLVLQSFNRMPRAERLIREEAPPPSSREPEPAHERQPRDTVRPEPETVFEPGPQPEPEPEPEPEPQPTPRPAPRLVQKLPLTQAEIAGLIDSLLCADSFVEYDFNRRAGRIAERLVQAGMPAWNMVCSEMDSLEDEFGRSRLNAVLACMRWNFSPYFIYQLDVNFMEELYTREVPPKGEFFSPLETFFKEKDAAKLVHAFTLNDPDASFYIFDLVEKLGPAALRPLLEALSDEHRYFHFCVTVALMRLSPRVLKELRQFASDPSPAIRSRAVWALGLSGSKDAVPALVRALRDEESSVRSSAAYMLAMIPDRRSVPHLLKSLEDSDEDVASASADALGVIGDPAAIESLKTYVKSGAQDAGKAGMSALAGIGQQSAGVLLTFLKDEDSEIRTAAAGALAELRSPSTVNALIEALSDKDGSVRAGAADALGYTGGREVIPALGRALSDPDALVRSSVAYSFGRLQNPATADAVAVLLGDDDARVRLAAISSIAKIGGKRALELLVESLGDPELSPLAASGMKNYSEAAGPALIAAFPGLNVEGKCVAARLLAENGVMEAVPILVDNLAHPDVNVRFCADKALRIITGHETSYKCDAEDAERTKGREEWRTWWKEYREEQRRK